MPKITRSPFPSDLPPFRCLCGSTNHSRLEILETGAVVVDCIACTQQYTLQDGVWMPWDELGSMRFGELTQEVITPQDAAKQLGLDVSGN